MSNQQVEWRMDELVVEYQGTPSVKLVRKTSALSRLLARMNGSKFHRRNYH